MLAIDFNVRPRNPGQAAESAITVLDIIMVRVNKYHIPLKS